jgi:hypothetical protein
VDGHVSGQVVMGIEHFTTFVALENFGLVVDVIAELVDVMIG